MIVDVVDRRLGALVRGYRLVAELSRDDLATRLGQTRQWICDLEAGAVRVGPAQLQALAGVMNLSLQELFAAAESLAPAPQPVRMIA